MFSRLLSIAFVSVLAVTAQAQLPSARFSPINYFGRYHGFGYSDGYHACKEGRCNTWSIWKPWESMSKPWGSMSSLYGMPTPSSSNRAPSHSNQAVGIQTTNNSPMASQEFYATPIINRTAPPSGPQWSPAGPHTKESIPPNQNQIQLSPSDRPVRALSPLGTKSDFMPSLHQVPSRAGATGNYFEP